MGLLSLNSLRSLPRRRALFAIFASFAGARTMSFLSLAKALRADRAVVSEAVEPEHGRGSVQQMTGAPQPFRPVPPCPATVTERAALIEAGDGCDRAEADRRALAELGLESWAELANAHATMVRAALVRLPAPWSDHGRRLMKVTLHFLGSEHWRPTVACGWPLVELFGVHAFAPLVRIEAWGAITAHALSRMAPTRIECITPGEIVTTCRSPSAKLVHRAGYHGMEASVVWWECTELIGEHAA